MFWWRRSPTRVAIGFDEITSVDVDNEDGRKLLKVQASGRTLSGIPAGPGRAAALAISQRLVAHGRAHTIKNDDTRIHLRLDGYQLADILNGLVALGWTDRSQILTCHARILMPEFSATPAS